MTVLCFAARPASINGPIYGARDSRTLKTEVCEESSTCAQPGLSSRRTPHPGLFTFLASVMLLVPRPWPVTMRGGIFGNSRASDS